jgi:hypothetical protein
MGIGFFPSCMPVQWHVGRPLAVICHPGIVVHSQLDFGRLPWKILSTNPPRDRGSDLKESLLPRTALSYVSLFDSQRVFEFETFLWLRFANYQRRPIVQNLVYDRFRGYLSSKRSERRGYG